MARLPSVGSDNGQWGQILNDFLSVEHNADGTLKKAADISNAQSAANAAQVDAQNAQSTANGKYTKPGAGIPEADLDTDVQAKLNTVPTGTPDATAGLKGKLQLAGDLTGTASSPQVAPGVITDAKIAIGANIGQSKIQNLTSDLAAKYVKPGPGIPTSDLTTGIQTSLGKADTAEQASNKGQAGGYASLDGGGKVPASQLPSAIMRYQGVWNASTNNPMLTNGSGDAGDVYRVSVSGTQNLGSGSITFDVGDYVVYNPSGVWEKSDTTDSVASVAGKIGVVTLDKNDVGLGNVPNTDATLRANHTGSQTASTISDFDSAADARITAQKGQLGGLATLDGTGKIPGTQLPALAITNTFSVNSQSAQLALTAQEGDLAIRTDEGKTYVHNGGTSGTMTDWSELLSVGDQASLGTKVSKAGDTMTGSLVMSGATTMLTFPDNLGVTGGITFGGDTNLYRSVAQNLKTDGNLRVGNTLLAKDGAAEQVNVGYVAAGKGGLLIGTAADTNLYRNAANELETDDAFTLSSTGAALGIRLYNTADQITNYERIRAYWSGNIATIGTEFGGTGTLRPILISALTTAGGLRLNTTSSAGWVNSNLTSSTNGSISHLVDGTLSATTGTQYALSIAPTMTQTSTAGYTMLRINPTETTTGSGSKLLADFQVGGVSKTKIDNTGNYTLSNGGGLTLYNTTDEVTNYERFRAFWSSNVLNLKMESGGTGTQRDFVISTNNNSISLSDSSGISLTRPNNTSLVNIMTFGNGTMTGSSGTQTLARILATANQTSTAGYTGLLVNITETATGSGSKTLADFQIGGTSRVNIDNTGKFNWTTDTNLYRSAADTLKTDDSLIVSKNFSVLAGTGSGFASIAGTLTDTANASSVALSVSATINPASASAADFRTLNMSALITGSANFSNAVKGAHLEARWAGSGNVTGTLTGAYGVVLMPSGATSFGTIASAVGINGQGISEFASTAITGTVTTAIGLQASANSKTNITIQNTIGVDVQPQSLGTVSNIGVKIAKANTYSLQLTATDGSVAGGITFGTDTNLYRSAADTLKTDDAFVVGSNRLNIATAKTPSSATDTGTTGDIAWDANYVYVCVATNTWKRTALSTW